MKKELLSMLVLAVLAVKATATMVVIDPTKLAQDAGNEITNLGHWVATETAAVQTQLNTLQTYENTVLQVARMGNPAALRAIPGVSQIAELYQIYGALQQDYASIQGLANPQNLQGDFNSILNSYRYPNWQGYLAANGTMIGPSPSLYQFPTSDYNIGQNLTDQLTQLDQKKASITQQRDQVLQLLQGATTDAEVKKYHAILDGLNAAIADVNQSEQELVNRGRIQQTQNASAQRILQASQAERQRGADLQSLDRDLMSLPLNGVHQTVNWNGNGQ